MLGRFGQDREQFIVALEGKGTRDPLHGITLEHLLKQLVARHGWAELGRRIPIRCFLFDPSVNSSLKFLRKTPWARQRVEDWFIQELRQQASPHPPRHRGCGGDRRLPPSNPVGPAG